MKLEKKKMVSIIAVVILAFSSMLFGAEEAAGKKVVRFKQLFVENTTDYDIGLMIGTKDDRTKFFDQEIRHGEHRTMAAKTPGAFNDIQYFQFFSGVKGSKPLTFSCLSHCNAVPWDASSPMRWKVSIEGKEVGEISFVLKKDAEQEILHVIISANNKA